MNIIEALMLAKEKPGTKVRPVCWAESGGDIGIIYTRGMMLCQYSGEIISFRLDDERELLGEWEVVP